MMEQEPRVTQDFVREARTTLVEVPGFYEDADLYINLTTDTISNRSVGDYNTAAAELKFGQPIESLDEEQILLLLDGTLKAIYLQENRMPDFTGQLDSILSKYIKRGNGDGQTKEPNQEA